MDEKAFALLEYQALRAEILVRIAASQALERNAVIAAIVIWGFLLTHPPAHPWQRAAWLLPQLIAMGGLLRANADEKVFRLFGMYIAGMETRLIGDVAYGGWERFRVAYPPKMCGCKVDVFWGRTFWGVFLIAAWFAAWFGITQT